MSGHRGRRASLAFILVAVFVDMLGIGIAIPVLPMLVGEFSAGHESQAYWYGILVVAYGLMQFLCSPLLGALSDRFGRRPLLIASIIGLGFHYFMLASATSLAMMLVARVIGGINGASLAVANAYISDVTPAEGRAKAFGMIGAVFGLGFITGPALGGILGHIDLRLPFYVAAALSFANAVYGYYVVPESLPRDQRAPFALARANPFAALLRLARRRDIGGLTAVFALAVLAQMLLQTTWVLFTHFRFGWGPRENGFALFCVGLVAAVVQGLLLSRIVGRMGEVRTALAGLASGVVAYMLYGLAPEGWMMYAIIVANFLAFAAGPVLQGIVSRAISATEQGVTMGSLNAINSVAFVLAPSIGTPLLALTADLPATDLRGGVTFYLCAALQLGALVIAIRQLRHLPAAAKAASSP
jgi:DHA1 family tetracycline resistance protein-like MFS transporter